MPEWHCRLVVPGRLPERCEGPDHGRCGQRFLPGEYTLTGDSIILPGIGTVRMEGAAFAPKGAPVTVYRDTDGWAAEFTVTGPEGSVTIQEPGGETRRDLRRSSAVRLVEERTGLVLGADGDG